MFEKSKNYKYIMVSMGSILEFILIRYCEKKIIPPSDYELPNGSIIRANKKRLVRS